MRHLALSLLPVFLALGACSAPAPDSVAPDSGFAGWPVCSFDGPRPLPTLRDATQVWDSAGALGIDFFELLDRLAEFDVVFLGETHLDDTTHRVEAAVLEGLLQRRKGQVVLSLEMFERDVQPVLDDYLAGKIDEPAFLAASRPWNNYATDYRPLIEIARTHAIPVVASNAPAALRRRVSSGGRDALDALSPDERRLLPDAIYPASTGYWERVDRATRGHMGFAALPDEKRLYTGQNLWDNSMGEACARALEQHPGSVVLHVVGGFHVQYHDGTVAQFRRRAPDAKSAVVEVFTSPAPGTARPERNTERADYLVYASELARSLSDDTYAVSVATELRYTIDLPASASEDAPVPLVLWLPDAGERPADVRELLRAALGDEAAIAVLEPPIPELAADLAPGGRWARASCLNADLARVQVALERIVEYVTRRLPVSISGEPVVVGGRGLGATAALWSATSSEWLDARFVAVAPRGAGALRLEGLPDHAPATASVRILVDAAELEDAQWLHDDFATLGTPAELGALAADVPLARQIEDALREALELVPPAVHTGQPELCALERDLPRARQWAEVFARRLGRDARVVLASELTGQEDPAHVHRLAIGSEWPLASFADGAGLPLAEGDFGGTTVLVVPAGVESAEREAWLDLERTNALKKRSPFAGLRVALADGEPGLAAVLTELRDAGSRSVLVVPATFCASAAEMQALRSSIADDLAADLDLAWSPGLGAELCCAPAED